MNFIESIDDGKLNMSCLDIVFLDSNAIAQVSGSCSSFYKN